MQIDPLRNWIKKEIRTFAMKPQAVNFHYPYLERLTRKIFVNLLNMHVCVCVYIYILFFFLGPSIVEMNDVNATALQAYFRSSLMHLCRLVFSHLKIKQKRYINVVFNFCSGSECEFLSLQYGEGLGIPLQSKK